MLGVHGLASHPGGLGLLASHFVQQKLYVSQGLSVDLRYHSQLVYITDWELIKMHLS